MKLKLITVAIAITATPVLAAMGTTDMPIFAGQAASVATANAASPKTPEEWLTRMTDFSRNLSAFKDPKVFVPWTNAVTEPGFYVAMANGMMDPGGWLNMMNSAAQPNAVRNLAQFADPNIYLKWAAATGDPNFYTALLTQLSDPGKAMRWAMLPADARLWNTLLSTLNPNTYIRWGLAGMDPRAWNLAATMANPALYTGMMGAVVNPYSYGQGTSSWLNWAPQPTPQGAGSFNLLDPVAMLGNLSGFAPGINLPTLPNIGLPTLPTFSQPTLPATAPAFNSAAPLYPQVTERAKPVETARPAVEPHLASPEVAAIATKAVEPPVKAAEPAKAVEPPVKVVEPARVIVLPQPVAATPAPLAVEPAKPIVAASPAQGTKVEAATVPAVVATSAQVAQSAPASSKVILAGDALFQSGKSGVKDLSRDGKTRLDEVIAKIKGMGSIERIRVVGHADPTGKAKANHMLSEARAKSVKAYLVARGIKPDVILTSGMGDAQPVVQCEKTLTKPELKACNEPNRRVEIEIIGKAK